MNTRSIAWALGSGAVLVVCLWILLWPSIDDFKGQTIHASEYGMLENNTPRENIAALEKAIKACDGAARCRVTISRGSFVVPGSSIVTLPGVFTMPGEPGTCLGSLPDGTPGWIPCIGTSTHVYIPHGNPQGCRP